MTKGNGMTKGQWLAVTMLVAMAATQVFAKAMPLPRVQVTRYISPAGIEHLNLDCQLVSGTGTYRCFVQRERNGKVLSRAAMSAEEVTHSLKRYFQLVPREEIYKTGKVPAEKWEQKSGTALVWSVSWGDYATKGSVPYNRDKDSDGLLAILSLEMDLSLVGVVP